MQLFVNTFNAFSNSTTPPQKNTCQFIVNDDASIQRKAEWSEMESWPVWLVASVCAREHVVQIDTRPVLLACVHRVQTDWSRRGNVNHVTVYSVRVSMYTCIAQCQQVSVQLPTYADNVPLHAFTRRCSNPSISPAGWAHSSKAANLMQWVCLHFHYQ